MTRGEYTCNIQDHIQGSNSTGFFMDVLCSPQEMLAMLVWHSTLAELTDLSGSASQIFAGLSCFGFDLNYHIFVQQTNDKFNKT